MSFLAVRCPRRHLVGLALLLALASSCRRERAKADGDARATPSVSAAAHSPSAPPPLVAPSIAAPSRPAACRAMRVSGTVETAAHEPIVTLGALDGRSWLRLTAGSELVVRHAASAREYALRGPGLALPCRGGLEQVLLATGSFTSSRGTGVRPGAEVWLATPFGAARYGDADVTAKAEKGELKLEVRSGPVFVEAAKDLTGANAGQLSGPNGRANARGTPDPHALTRACETAARAAHEAAKSVLGAKAAELGAKAAEQLRRRREARAHCMVAEVGVALLTEPEAAARLGDQVRHADAEWRGVPSLTY